MLPEYILVDIIRLKMSDYLEFRRQHILSGRPLPEKKKYKIPAKSAKRIAKEKEQKEALGGELSPLDQWFEDRMKESAPVCAECGMDAQWVLQPQYNKIWKACQAHILPKKKGAFPSVAAHPLNHIVLFPSWGGHLCGDHGFYDSNWYNATTMKIWPIVEQRVWELYPLLNEAEKKRLPDALKKMIENRTIKTT